MEAFIEDMFNSWKQPLPTAGSQKLPTLDDVNGWCTNILETLGRKVQKKME